MNEQSKKCNECPDGRVRNEAGKCVMPEVTFASFILSLNTTALFHLGELPHPESGKSNIDLELVKHTIDTLSLLHDKTKGNLDKDEEELMKNVIYDLKIRFVKASGNSTAS